MKYIYYNLLQLQCNLVYTICVGSVEPQLNTTMIVIWTMNMSMYWPLKLKIHEISSMISKY